MRKPGKIEDRFWPKVRKTDGCWEWVASRNPQGYGQLSRPSIGGGAATVELAHRVSMRLAGHDLEDKYVLHHCDNRGCVRPDHLYLGTQADNIRDMLARGRQVAPRGESSGRAKLTEDDVRQIRKDLSKGVPQALISRKYGVHQKTIADIHTRKNWGWLK